ncbi:phosphatidylinositol transfer protein beta isoform-like isoform X1 [Acanthaster planci]|uniref:Phosphatidylinositol transfer protein beta isoform-like isoform X1 n=1 Tax=Acanthaster planci TaxID=133434 RepID=A0A8B7YUB6_ACAPL|nr:phosphatidylinositol transfer protein beta isoform-like isoform X1 [Acanthaster planci]
MVLRREYRIVLPLTVEEYQVAQLWAVAEASKNETGGGEGIEVVENRPYTKDTESGQYTYKIYHLKYKVPGYIRALAPKGALEMVEEAWNAYPYCKTVITNPAYMGKEKMSLTIETWHKADRGELHNVHDLPPEKLAKRDVVHIDIAHDKIKDSDYKADQDPKLVVSRKLQRGPLKDPNWKKTCEPHMCAYKLVTIEFIWWGLQGMVESWVLNAERRVFTNFHRQVYCWMDKWAGLTMEDIRAIEDKTKKELEDLRLKGELKGTVEK